jgi:hypothetical protein
MDLHDFLLEKWVENNNNHYYLTEFYYMKRSTDDTLANFNRTFQFFYHTMAMDTHPSKSVAKVYYVTTHEPNFYFLLKE